ncbi:MAG: hypothetical protein EXQ90_03785 [Rhodospirillales bacterium]|nr:hypothetical protein [Rhodospirillales bacterium]
MTEKTIPIIAPINNAFGSVFSRSVMLSAYTLYCVGFLFIARVAIVLAIDVFHWEGRPWIYFASRLPLILVLTPFAIGIQRHIVLGTELPTNPFDGFFSETNLRFALIAGLLGVPFYFLQNVPTLFPVSYAGPWFWLVNLAPLVTMLTAVIMVRLYIKLPLIAIREELPFVLCWQATRGNHWQLFASNVLMGAILAAIGWTMTMAYGNLKPGFSWGRLVVDGVVTALWALYVALAVALIAHWLAFFIEQKRIPQPGGNPAGSEDDEAEADASEDEYTETAPPPLPKPKKKKPTQFIWPRP